MDRSKRWPEAVPMANVTASYCAPRPCVRLDRQIRFASSHHLTLLHRIHLTTVDVPRTATRGVTIHHTASYNPEASGIVERLHRTLKAPLMFRGTDAAWCSQLPLALLSLQTALKDGLDTLPAELAYGDPLVIPRLGLSSKPYLIRAFCRKACPLPTDVQDSKPLVCAQRPTLFKERLPQERRQRANAQPALVGPL
ncbi:uncharacterized protein LOC143019867 [Oratosquilla oratoria]|uniref:uncharacterized protein LOC143019867 n=1 Tax=Oratosquilla oratoria TaxID=337810 RepID=UPI003F76CC5E